jgi:hypothetical protein
VAGFYDKNGNFVENATVGLRNGGGALSPTVSVEVDAACERVRESGSALVELKKLFDAHPLLRSDRWSYPDNPHPLSRLVALYVDEVLS